MDNATRPRAAGLSMPPGPTGTAALTPKSEAAAAPPRVDVNEVSAKLNAFFDEANADDRRAINRVRFHIIDRVLAGESDVTVDLPDHLMAELRALGIAGITISSPPKASASGDYPPPQPVVHIPEMKLPPPPRAPVTRQPPRQRTDAEMGISRRIGQLGQGMPGYGGADRTQVITMACEAIARQIAATPDEPVRQELRLEMAGALLQVVNADPKRTSLANRMFELHLPSLQGLNAPELERQLLARIERLPNIRLDTREAYAASLKREFRAIADACAGVTDAGQRSVLMGRLVNMLTRVFDEQQKPGDYEQCMYLHGLVTEIIDGGQGGVGGLRKAVSELPVGTGWVLAAQREEFLQHMTPDSVRLHLKALPPPLQSSEEHVLTKDQLAALRARGLID